MLVPVAIHPGPQCLRANAELPSDIGDRTRTLNHRFDGFTLKLRRKTLPLFRHLTSSIPEKEPIGSHVRNLRGSPQCIRVLTGGEPVRQPGPADPSLAGLAFGPLVAIQPDFDRVGEIRTNLDKRRTEILIEDIEVIAGD